MAALLHMAQRGQTGMVRFFNFVTQISLLVSTKINSTTISLRLLANNIGEACCANSAHVVRLLPHNLTTLHDGGGAGQLGRHEGQLEGLGAGNGSIGQCLVWFPSLLAAGSDFFKVRSCLVNVWFSLLWRKTFFYGVLQSQCASSINNKLPGH